jgi:hypothetical protein
MAGGLLQLVANGAQDVYLTSNPQITFFKVVYRRHTNFSIESIKQTFNGTADFGQDVSITIQRNADLVYRMYFQTDIPQVNVSYGLTAGTTKHRAFRWLNWLGHLLLKTMEVTIGGHKIDKQYGEWLHIWNELSGQPNKQHAYAEMVGNVPKLTQIYSTNSDSACQVDSHTLFIPFQFWFCRNPGLALPLIALQYSDININITLRELKECIWAAEQSAADTYTSVLDGVSVLGSQTLSLSNTHLWVDYIYLDTDERRRFAKVAHEYLIETLQYNGGETVNSTNPQIKLNFTHPVKELIWTVQPTNFTKIDYSQCRGGNQPFNFTDLWDYSGFNGTPEPKNGVGMPGGRIMHNRFSGYPEVCVEGRLDSTNQWSKSYTNSSGALSAEDAGFVDISQYTTGNTINTYGNRYGHWSLNGGKRTDQGDNPISKAKLILNGNDRFAERKGNYFNLVQPYDHHTNVPASGINCYSFALNPEDIQPSGTCNFSRIDNASLDLTLTDNAVSSTINNGNVKIQVYATNYNILRVMSGLGGLAYSN